MTEDSIQALSTLDLDKMDEEIRKERARRYEERIANETAELKRLGEERGFLVEEIFSGKRVSNSPKFRHPADATLTWSGRGRRPHWLNELLNSGTDIEDLRVS